MQAETLVINIPARSAELAPIALTPHRIACYQWGNPAAKETILCMHGLTRNGRDFDYLAAALAEKYRVLCPDMPGRGASDRLPDPAGYNYATYVADIQYVLDAFHLTSVHWIGTSMGGIVAMMLANMRPGLIRTLTLNDIGTRIPAAGLQRILSYVGVKVAFPTREKAEQALREICAPFGLTDENHWKHFLNNSITQHADGSYGPAYDPAIAAGFAGSEITDIDLSQFWPGVAAIPTLLVRGAHSDILTQQTAQEMQQTHPDLTLYEVENAGHAPALMADAQIRFIQNWLETTLRD